MTVWDAMSRLEQLGYRFEITTERKIKGTFQGTKPPEASVLLEIVRHDHESAVAYVLEHKVRRNAVINRNTYSVFDAVAVSEAVQAGEARLLGVVIYHRQANNVTIRWEPCNGQDAYLLLRKYRETLLNTLQNRVRAMERLPDRELTDEEIGHLNNDYTHCLNLLNDYEKGLSVKEPCYE